MFRIGQKVVCVDDAGGSSCLRIDQVYVCLGVDATFLNIDCCNDGRCNQNHAWYRYRFRPVVERKTDISIFTKMLTPTKRHADA